ncbi:MAG: hypothetical protein PWP27_2728 [Clostridiales bacterium]|jgi:predicted NBD/HSP70 family sugar kinase|nr:hypothetical protein [Clostridiales bacterium]MDK2934918.1 hypothetical protein [Clostridiales bacterium]
MVIEHMIKLNTVDHETIRKSNRRKILSLLYQKRELTKQEISKETGISIPTVTNNINELIAEGIIEEAGVADSTGGRKPVIVRFIPDSRYSFGINIDLDHVRIILTNLDSQIKYDTCFSITGFDNIEEIFQRIYKIVNQVIEENNIPKKNISGIGFSLPGTVNEEKMLLELAPNLGVRNIDFKIFTKLFSLPIYIENEANAAAFAELTLGIGQKLNNLIYISVTQGIGTGIVIKDYLYKGKNKRAGEFGHTTIVAGGQKCSCGKNGCWELYASDRALLKNYNKETQSNITSLKEFFTLLRDKNYTAQKVWESYLDYLAIGIQNIILSLDPHYIIIGGEISQLEDLLLEPLKERVFIENSFYKEGDTKILTSRLKENSSILGASLLPFQELFFVNEKII